MTFMVDDEVVGTFTLPPTTGDQLSYEYNVPVYVNDTIPAGMHTFTIQNGHQGGEQSLVMLDYIMYT